jgi:hypothetical protein
MPLRIILRSFASGGRKPEKHSSNPEIVEAFVMKPFNGDAAQLYVWLTSLP